MRFILPDELPAPALEAVHATLRRDGEDPASWTVTYVWKSNRRPPSFAVVTRWDEETRAFTVIPAGAGGFEAWDVTDG